MYKCNNCKNPERCVQIPSKEECKGFMSELRRHLADIEREEKEAEEAARKAKEERKAAEAARKREEDEAVLAAALIGPRYPVRNRRSTTTRMATDENDTPVLVSPVAAKKKGEKKNVRTPITTSVLISPVAAKKKGAKKPVPVSPVVAQKKGEKKNVETPVAVPLVADKNKKPVASSKRGCPLENSNGWVEGDKWEVESILTSIISRNRDGEEVNRYKVKWKGWPVTHEDWSWIKEEDLFPPHTLCRRYWRKYLSSTEECNRPFDIKSLRSSWNPTTTTGFHFSEKL